MQVGFPMVPLSTLHCSISRYALIQRMFNAAFHHLISFTYHDKC